MLWGVGEWALVGVAIAKGRDDGGRALLGVGGAEWVEVGGVGREGRVSGQGLGRVNDVTGHGRGMWVVSDR